MNDPVNDPGMKPNFPDPPETPVLREMRPHALIPGGFTYSFDLFVRGNPNRAERLAEEEIPKMMEALPEEIRLITNTAWGVLAEAKRELDNQRAELKRREEEVKEENRRLMLANDEVDKLTKDLLNRQAELDAGIERGKMERKNWRDRLARLVDLKTEDIRRDAALAIANEERKTRELRRDLEDLERSLQKVGSYFRPNPILADDPPTAQEIRLAVEELQNP